MNKALRSALFSCIVLSLIVSSSAQACNSHTFSQNRLFRSCNQLTGLNSFLHWNYDSSTGQTDIAYRRPSIPASTWIAWAINPTGQGMIGAQSLVAFVNTSGAPHAYTAPVTGYTTTMAEGRLSFQVSDLTAEFRGGELIIFATLRLSSGTTSVNQVWQEGPLSGNTPGRHGLNGANVNSKGSLNLLSGASTNGGGGIPRLHRKNTHGVLNAVSWGVLMPMGAMIARYLKVSKSADPAWFYLHVACQSSAYIVGVAGWATGIKLGSDSSGIKYNAHRNIGIALFCLGTLQVFALLLRPKKDHKYRIYWNIYHHSTGYAVIILSIINIFKGFDILDPEKKWKRAYIGILIALGAIALALEAFTWFVVIGRKKNRSDKFPHSANRVNGTNGHTSRTQDV